MNKLLKITTLFTALLIWGCSQQLNVPNPNAPTLSVVQTEDGMKRLALGVYGVNNSSDLEGGLLGIRYMWIALANHEIMGDALFIPWGNFAWRWANQVTSVTLDNGTVVGPPAGGNQRVELTNRNTRGFGNDNAFLHEWQTMYFVNNISNVILENIDQCKFGTNAESKRAILRAWARFWKGYAYSRIGSMYSAGLILNQSGVTSGAFVTNDAIITEANAQFDLAITALQALPAAGDAGTSEILLAAIPDFCRGSVAPTPAEMIRNANSLKARNLMVNKRVADMTATDWNNIITLANAGLQQNDFIFYATIDGQFLTSTAVPIRTLPDYGWHFVSERLIQDYKTGDARRDRFFTLLPATAWYVNLRSRGIMFGTRWDLKDSELGSLTPKVGRTYFGATYEENQLMLAEAKVRTNDINGGLAHVDAVRSLQTAGLAAVANTGLTQAQAIEEVRRERRVGLFLRGLSFYDARRWGVLDPVAQGGGRTGAVVLDAAGNLNTNCTIDYNYLSYFGAPAGELDFNPPSAGAANVAPR